MLLPVLNDCRECELGGTAKWSGVPGMVVEGCPEVGHALVWLGALPGNDEANSGNPFSGPASLILKGSKLRKLPGAYLDGQGFRDSFTNYLLNTVRCYNAGNDAPAVSVKACQPHLLRDLQAIASKHLQVSVICLGNKAKEAFSKYTAHDKVLTKTKIKDMQEGHRCEVEGVGPVTVYATYAPGFVLHSPNKMAEVSKHLRLIRMAMDGHTVQVSKPDIITPCGPSHFPFPDRSY